MDIGEIDNLYTNSPTLLARYRIVGRRYKGGGVRKTVHYCPKWRQTNFSESPNTSHFPVPVIIASTFVRWLPPCYFWQATTPFLFPLPSCLAGRWDKSCVVGFLLQDKHSSCIDSNFLQKFPLLSNVFWADRNRYC